MATNVIMIPRQESPWTAMLPTLVAGMIQNNMRNRHAKEVAKWELEQKKLTLDETRAYEEALYKRRQSGLEAAKIAGEERQNIAGLKKEGFTEISVPPPGQIEETDLMQPNAGPSLKTGVYRDMYGKKYQRPYTPAEQKSLTEKTGGGFKDAAVLRKEFNTQSKDYVGVRDAYGRILASAKDPSAAGDLAMIFNYMKVLDPGSTVREGEFATAQNSAGLPERLRAQYNRIIGGERLSVKTRGDFVTRAKMLYERQEKSHRQLRDEYGRISKNYGVPESNVLVNYLMRPEALAEEMSVQKNVKDSMGAVDMYLKTKNKRTIDDLSEDEAIELEEQLKARGLMK